jgi:RNA polymerase sigma-70 factor (ECF subfamily)
MTDVTMEDTSMHDNALRSARATDRISSVPPGSGFDQIFSRYVDPIYRFLYRRVGNREDAEDLTSKVFLKASRQLNMEGPEASIAHRLFTDARTVLADHRQRYYRARAVRLLDDQPIEDVGPRDSDLPSAAVAQMVQALLNGLPGRHRTVLELRFLRGYSIQEIALEMGVTPETAKVMQHRALAEAAQAVKDHQPSRGPGCVAGSRNKRR